MARVAPKRRTQKPWGLLFEQILKFGQRCTPILGLNLPFPQRKVRAEVCLFFVGLPKRSGFLTLVVYVRVKKLAVLAAVQVHAAMLAGVCPLHLVNQFRLSATRVAIKQHHAQGPPIRPGAPRTAARQPKHMMRASRATVAMPAATMVSRRSRPDLRPGGKRKTGRRAYEKK